MNAGVNHRCCQTFVTQQLLDRGYITASIHQLGSKGVAEHMGGNLYASAFACPAESAAYQVFLHPAHLSTLRIHQVMSPCGAVQNMMVGQPVYQWSVLKEDGIIGRMMK